MPSYCMLGTDGAPGQTARGEPEWTHVMFLQANSLSTIICWEGGKTDLRQISFTYVFLDVKKKRIISCTETFELD